MIRRITAVLGIIVLVAAALLLLWRIYAHHRSTASEEPSVVSRSEKIFQTLS